MVADSESGTTAGWCGEGITGCRLHRDEALLLVPTMILKQLLKCSGSRDGRPPWPPSAMAEGLDRDGVDTLVGEMHFTGKRPLRDEVLGLLKEKPGIRRQKKVVEKVIKAIEDLVEAFDDGFGEADQ